MSLSGEITSSSSCVLKRRFSLNFLKTLKKIKKSGLHPPSRSSSLDIRKRAQRIKLAAYSSMARAVGSRRAWSRALLLRLHARKTTRGSIPVKSSWRFLGMVRKRPKVVTKKWFVPKKHMLEKESSSGVDELRRLVPGGESMDLSILFEETAHFVRCLETQVKVMRSIADHFPC